MELVFQFFIIIGVNISLLDGITWKVENGVNISIFYYHWVSRKDRVHIDKNVSNGHLELVAKLVDLERRQWNRDLVTYAFDKEDAELMM